MVQNVACSGVWRGFVGVSEATAAIGDSAVGERGEFSVILGKRNFYGKICNIYMCRYGGDNPEGAIGNTIVETGYGGVQLLKGNRADYSAD